MTGTPTGIHVKMRRGMRLVLSLVLSLLFLTPAALQVNAEGSDSFVPLGSSNEFYPVLYDNTNGLPTAEANDIAQTSEGFIWIACYAGLIRYDGNTFERLDSTTGLNSIACLRVDSLDRLWVGTNDSGVAVMEDGEFTFWSEEDGLGSSKVCDIAQDSNGNIYVGTTSGVTMFSPDLGMTKLTDERIENVYVERMVAGDEDLIYCTTNRDEIFILRDGNLVNFYESDDSGIEGISAIYPDPGKPGMVYYGTENSGIYYVDLKAGTKKTRHINIDPLYSVNEMMQLGDRLWICSRVGIGVIDKDGFHSMDYLPLNNSVDTMMEDYEGNLWFTSSRLGLMKLVTNRFSDISAEYGIDKTVVNSTCLLDGKMYIGSDTGLTVIDEQGIVDSVPITSAKTVSGAPLNAEDLIQLLGDSRIRSIIRDSKDRLWITSWQDLGLLCFDHGDLTVFNKEEGLLSDRVRCVYEMRSGAMMVALTGGLNIIDNGQITASYGHDFGIENDETLIVSEAPNGDMLIGSNGEGIYILNDEGIRNINKKDGLTSGVVMRIKYDEENKVFWLVTGNSLAYMTEDYEVTTIKKFPFPDNLDLVKNSKGDMWILSTDGIYVIPAAELLANEEMDPVHYDMANGLPCIATSNAFNELTSDGDLYISGRTGVARVNIETPLEEIGDIKMSVPFVEVNDVPVYPDENGVFVIPANTRKLAVCGYVFTYALTDPVISFKLEGFDDNMMTLTRSEFDKVYYTNLRGGTYTFVMELKDSMERESSTLSTTIIKEKAFFEEPIFIGTVFIAAAMVLLVIIQKVIGDKLSELERKNNETRKQEAAARELQMANRIQTGILPHEFPPFPEHSEFDLFASMEPAREVGGDFYDFFMTDDDHLCLVIADVSGKGIPAALFMMNVKVLLKSLTSATDSPAEILLKANKEICDNNQTDMFVTVWMGILDIRSGLLTAANAGHEYPVVGRPGTGFELVKDKHGFVLGGMAEVKYQDYELQLEPGDKVFLYTDGVPEATNADKELFGTDRMLEALNSDMTISPEQMLEKVSASVAGFVGEAEKFDDLTMLALEYRGQGH